MTILRLCHTSPEQSHNEYQRWASAEVACPVTTMKQFRERGIYQTPDGQRFVASRFRQTTADGRRILSALGGDLSCYLFSAYQWAFHGWPDYEVALAGKLIGLNQAAALSIDELVDTGATAGSH